MKIALAFFHLGLIFFFAFTLAKKWKVVHSRLFWISLLYRLIAGVSLGLVYLYYYSANDTWSYFEDARKISAVAHHDSLTYFKMLFDFGENQKILPSLVNQDLRSVFFIKIVSFFCLISLDNYWVAASYFSFLSFIASWYLHRTISKIFPGASVPSALSFLFFPTAVFWSSGIIKETIALSALYFLFAVILKIISRRKIHWYSWSIMVGTALVLWNLKYYWAAVFFVSTGAGVIFWFLSSRLVWLKKYPLLFWGFLFVFGGLLATFSHPNFSLSYFLDVVVSSNHDFVKISDSRNVIHYYHLTPDWISIVINSPFALMSGLFRPFLGEGQGLLGLVASLENFFLLVLFGSSIFYFRKTFDKQNKIILIIITTYAIVLCIFLALSTPNFGTLSRYRIGFLPFLVFVLSCNNPMIRFITNKFWPTQV